MHFVRECLACFMCCVNFIVETQIRTRLLALGHVLCLTNSCRDKYLSCVALCCETNHDVVIWRSEHYSYAVVCFHAGLLLASLVDAALVVFHIHSKEPPPVLKNKLMNLGTSDCLH